MPTVSPWTDERVEQLKVLFALKYSTQRIADELGNGISRCAVIGRLHRMGLKSNGVKPTETLRNVTDRPRPKLRIVSVNGLTPALRVVGPSKCVELPPLRRCDEIEPRYLTLLELGDNDCHWPVMEESPHFFCGHQRLEGAPQPYCAKHMELSSGGIPQRAHIVPRPREIA